MHHDRQQIAVVNTDIVTDIKTDRQTDRQAAHTTRRHIGKCSFHTQIMVVPKSRIDPTTATFYKTVVDEYDSVAWTTRLLGITIENTYI